MKLSRLRVEPRYKVLLPLILLGVPAGKGFAEVLIGGNPFWWLPAVLGISVVIFMLFQALLWYPFEKKDKKGNCPLNKKT